MLAFTPPSSVNFGVVCWLETEPLLFEVVLTHLKTRGWLTERQCQRTDSTHLLAAVGSLNRLELVGRTLQHALNTLAGRAPDWLLTQSTLEWFEHYSHPLDEYRLPKEKAECPALAEQIGKDGQHLLVRMMQPLTASCARANAVHYDAASGLGTAVRVRGFPDPVASYGEVAPLKRTYCLTS